MPAKYCLPVGRRVAPVECGNFEACKSECELRPIIQDKQPASQTKTKPGSEPGRNIKGESALQKLNRKTTLARRGKSRPRSGRERS